MASFDNYETKFILLALSLEKANQADLDLLVSRIRKLIQAQTSVNGIKDPVLLTNQINKVIDKFYTAFVDNLEFHAGALGKAGADHAIQEIAPLLSKAGLYTEAVKLFKDVRNYQTTVQKRLMVDGWSGRTLNYRIVTLKSGTQKTVQNIIVNGTSNKQSARQIQKAIEQYISPIAGGYQSSKTSGKSTTKPLDEYRKRFGRPKSYRVPGIPRGSVQYNAYRIARTEMAHIYQQGTTDFYNDKEWVKGYTWKLSPDHPATDICDAYAEVKLYKTADDLPRRHPMCLCRVRPVIMTIDELKNLRPKNQPSNQRIVDRLAINNQAR